MGMFGFACSRCWDKDCDCTKEEMDEYHRKLKERLESEDNILKKNPYTKTYPHAIEGDLIRKDGCVWSVKCVEDGIGYMDKLTNDADLMEFDVELKVPYEILSTAGLI